jgi:catechol 2,3-dioxygenase-like lactoylglutathione lyase family enzyme
MPGGVRLVLEEEPGLSAEAEMDHVHVFTPQDRALLAWYAGVFGAAPGDDGGTAHLPGSGLRFSNSEEERTPTEGTALDHIGFEVEDLRAFVERLRGEGVEIVVEPRYIERIDLWIAFFVDAGGVLVELTEGLDRY